MGCGCANMEMSGGASVKVKKTAKKTATKQALNKQPKQKAGSGKTKSTKVALDASKK